jgi:hypothetical protein
MFQMLSESEKHTMGIFINIDSVAQWLYGYGEFLKNNYFLTLGSANTDSARI